MPEETRANEPLTRGLALHRDGALNEAVACYRQAIELDPASAEAYNAMGGALANLGETEAAATALQQAIAIDPSFPDPYLHLGKLRRIAGQPQVAEPLLRQGLAVAPAHYSLLMELGAVCFLQNRFAEAAKCFEQALRSSPGDAHALHNLGRVAMETGRPHRAVDLYRQALEREPELAACYTNLGIAQRAIQDFDGARDSFEKAVQLEPRQAAATTGLASLLELEGRNDEALACVQAAIAIDDHPLLQLAAARIERGMAQADAAIGRVNKIKAHDLDDDARTQRAFLLGDLHHDLGRFDEAWSHYQEANRLKAVDYDPQDWSRRVDEIIAAFPDEEAARAKSSSERPVFIVGMPRSGTSLLEQILASHPQVFGGGELLALGAIVESIPQRLNGVAAYPEGVAALSARRLSRLGQAYLDELNQLAPDARRVTDKMWRNFEYLGLIERMLPGARVIHCQRDPLDTCLSCYFQNFQGRTGVPFSYDLAHLGAYYRDYARLMAHWRKVCTLPMFELSYESLVTEPEVTSRALVDFIGLPWDHACLDFHKSKRRVNTASAAQVRKPVYTAAIARHRHYEKFLGPLLEALQE